MDVLLDTNVLARCIEPAHPHHRVASQAVAALVGRGDRLCVVPQILYEYFVVCTRPQHARGGLGMSSAEGVAELERVQTLFALLPEPPHLYSTWLELIKRHGVAGKPAHDARIAAALIAAGIPTLLSFNAQDFARYPDLTVIDPAQLTSP